MALPGWNNANNFLMRSDVSKVDEDLTDFPVLITLNSGTGITGYDTTAVFDELRDDSYYTLSSGTLTSGTINLLLHCDGDQSDSKHTITFNNEPKMYSSEGPFGTTCTISGSYYFNGIDDSITVTDHADWDFGTDPFTIECWVKWPTVPTTTEELISTGSETAFLGASLGGFTFGWSASGNLAFDYQYDNTWEMLHRVSWTPEANMWYHITVTRDADNFRLFVNGSIVGATFTDYAGSINSTNALRIGSSTTDSGYFTGFMGEIRISKGITRWFPETLTPSEVSDDFTGSDDDPPDDSKWSTSGSPVIESNMLHFDLPAGDVEPHFQQIQAKWVIDGDFDIYMPFAGNANQNASHSAITFYINSVDSSKYWYLQIYLSTPTSTRAYIGSWAGAGTSYNGCGRTAIALRITRVAGEVNFYFDNGYPPAPFVWTKHTYSPIAGSDSNEKVKFRVYVNNTNDYPWLDYLCDFFTCASADAIYPLTAAFTPPTEPHTKDPYTKLLLHPEGDLSASEHTLTFNNGVKNYASQGKFDGSYYFDGTDDYISIPDSIDWDFGSGDFTIECYAKFAELGVSTKTLITQWVNDGSTNQSFRLFKPSIESLNFLMHDSTNTEMISLSKLLAIDSTTKWYHIAVSKQGSNAYLFLDGVMVDSQSSITASATTSNVPLLIGARWASGGSTIELPHKGYIDEIRIVKGEALYTSNFTPRAWPYKEYNSKYDVFTKLLLHADGDDSGNNHTINFNGGVKTYSSFGHFNDSYYFDGTDDCISIPDSNDWDLINGDFTIDLWANFASLDTNSAFVGHATDADNRWYFFYDSISAGVDALRFGAEIGGVNTLFDGDTWIPSFGVWYHIAFVKSGTTIYFFVDGNSKGVFGYYGTMPSLTDLLYIGANKSGTFVVSNFLNGYMSEIRISKGIARWAPETLTASEASDDFTGVNGEPPNTDLWSASAALVIQSNDLYIYNENPDPGVSLTSKFRLRGDFEIQMTLNSVMNNTTLCDTEFRFWDENQAEIWRIVVANNSVLMQLYINQWGTKQYDSGWAGGFNFVNDGTQDYTLRFVRSGNTVTGYIDITQIGSYTYASSVGVYKFNHSVSTWGAGRIVIVYFREFEVISADVIYSSYSDSEYSFTPPTEPYTTDSGTVLLLHPDGDESSSEHTLTFNNEPKNYSTGGKFNGTYYFDGTDDYISIPDSIDWDLGTDDFTIDCWVYPESHSTYGTFIGTRGVGGANAGIHFSIRDDTDQWRICVTDGSFYGSADTVSVIYDEWHHLALVRSGSNVTAYLNGSAMSAGTAGTTMTTSVISSAYYLGIGDDPTNSQPFKGYLSEIRISKGIARWTSNFIPPQSPYGSSSWFNRKKIAVTATDNVEKYDMFTRLLSSCGADRSPTKHTLTYNEVAVATDVKVFDAAYKFNGSTSWIQIPNHTDFDLGTADFTVDFRFRLTSTPSTVGILAAQDDSVGAYQMFYIHGSNTIAFRDNSTSYSFTWTATIDTWYHIAFIRDGNDLHLFVDGGFIETEDCTGSNYNTFGHDLGIGSTRGNRYNEPMAGYIEELRISDTVRWLGDPLTISAVSDTFTGTDGDPANPDIWYTNGISTIQNNKVNINSDEATNQPGGINSKFQFSGDFDMQFDWDMESWETGGTQNPVTFNIVCTNDYKHYLMRSYNSNGSIYQVITYNGAWATQENPWYVTTDLEGKFRITRTGSTVKFYVWSGSQWEWNGSSAGYTSTYSTSADTTNVALQIYQYATYELNANIDNFVVNSAGSIYRSTPPQITEPHVVDSNTKLLLHPRGDESQAQHTLTFNNGPKNYSTVSPFETTYSGSYYFDGTDDYISIPDNDDWDFGTGDFTIDAWLYRPSTDSDGMFISQCVDADNYWKFGANHWGGGVYKPNFQIMVGASLTSMGGVFELGTGWVHLAVVRHGDIFTVYKDGIFVDSHITSEAMPSFAADLRIGSHLTAGGWYYIDGNVAELRVSKGIARWTSDFTPPTAPYSKQSGVVEVPVEIESWDDENEEAFLWAKIPSIVSGTTTEINLHYDLEHDDNPYVGDTIDWITQYVWDENFVGVWHLNQDPSGGTGCILDSTINNNNGTPASMESADLVDSQIGKGLNFDPNDERVNFGQISALSNATTLTFEAITKQDTLVSDYDRAVSLAYNIENRMSILTNTSSNLAVMSEVLDDIIFLSSSTSASSYHQVTLVRDGTYLRGYVDGDQYNSVACAHDNSDMPGAPTLYIAFENGSSYYWDGVIDEVRISNIGRPAAWVKATNYSNFDTLFTVSAANYATFIFGYPLPQHLSTMYGLSQVLKLIVTITGSESVADSDYDATFYNNDGAVQIGTTLSGVTSGQYTSTTLDTLTGDAYEWYVTASVDGGVYTDTSDVYSFTNRYLCEGYVEVESVRASGVPVKLYRRSNGALIGGTTSAGVSGTFSIVTDYNEYHYAVALYDEDNTNAIIADWITP